VISTRAALEAFPNATCLGAARLKDFSPDVRLPQDTVKVAELRALYLWSPVIRPSGSQSEGRRHYL
jgi:hypothetical protein